VLEQWIGQLSSIFYSQPEGFHPQIELLEDRNICKIEHHHGISHYILNKISPPFHITRNLMDFVKKALYIYMFEHKEKCSGFPAETPSPIKERREEVSHDPT
jgi:hypothetical protein